MATNASAHKTVAVVTSAKKASSKQKVHKIVPEVKAVEKAKPTVAQCLYVSWYKFHKCTIKTCKNYTEMTEHQCLGVDRIKAEGAKIISDAEIHLYKFSKDGISTRLVQLRRKTATTRVQCMMILKEYLEYIRANKPSGGVFTSTELLAAEKSYPLKVSRLGWQNWMWEYFLDKEVWASFRATKTADLSSISFDQLLCMKVSKYKKLEHDFNHPGASKS
jgi:hypothetical protein